MCQYLKSQEVKSFDTFYNVLFAFKNCIKPVLAQTLIRQCMLKTFWAYTEFLQNELKSNQILYSQL